MPQAAAAGNDAAREEVAARLLRNGAMSPGDPSFMMGRGYDGPPVPPKKTWECGARPRDDHADHGAGSWLTASEFEDMPEVAAAKARQLAQLMRLSKKTVVYTGAGISAAVIGQAARSGQNKQGWVGNGLEASPTFTHYALGFLGRQGLLHGWVQQNHDGLPQKAGYQQELINEIHGSWFDPSNPVVCYGGTLHSHCYPWMHRDAREADLVIVLGTSLSGLNADQLASNCAARSMHHGPEPRAGSRVRVLRAFGSNSKDGAQLTKGLEGTVKEVDGDGDAFVRFEGGVGGQWVFAANLGRLRVVSGGGPGRPPSLGTVCINLQQTPQDGSMTLRLFGRSDDVLRRLLPELGFDDYVPRPPAWPRDRRVLVPYDAGGQRLAEGAKRWMWLDLRDGQPVRLHPGHNCQGSQQPGYRHIPDGKGEGTVRGAWERACCINVVINGTTMQLGYWWLEAAVRGAVPYLPVINTAPRFDEVGAGRVPADTAAEGAGSTVAAPAPAPRPPPVHQVALQQSYKLLEGASGNRHEWGLALAGAGVSRVRRVTYTLHPTFRDNVVARDRPPFRLGPVTGWGTFTVGVRVEWKEGGAVSAAFPLKWRVSTTPLADLLGDASDSSDAGASSDASSDEASSP